MTPTQAACYRHPGSAAGVTCQRCGQPICPQCMRQASVGFQCPDCVAAAARRSPTVTASRLGGDDDVATKGLIGVNVVVFLIAAVMGSPAWARAGGGLIERFGMVTAGVAAGEWWRVVTSGFLHAGTIHLLFNMYALWVLGRVLERALGTAVFLPLYALGLAGGSLGVVLQSSPYEITVGASGAIFGLMGALLVFEWMQGRNPFSSGIGSVVLLNLGITFVLPGISIGGHLGGLAAGALGGFVVRTLVNRRTSPAVIASALGAGAVLLFGLAIAVAPSML